MGHTHTEIVFTTKDELILNEIQTAFKGSIYRIVSNSDGLYTTTTVKVNKKIEPANADTLTLTGISVPYEALTHYKRINP